MTQRRLAAFAGSWLGCLADVRRELGEASLGAFASSCPDLWAAAEQAGNALRLGADEWLRAAAEPKLKAQKELARHERDESRKRLLAALPPEQAAQLRWASGVGAGRWLLSPT